MGHEYLAGHRTKEKLVIYRLKFPSKQDFAKAVKTMTAGKSFADYLESFRRTAKVPAAGMPEINFCHDDLCIYIVSREVEFSSESNIFFPVKAGYFRLYLQTAFASAEIQVTSEI